MDSIMPFATATLGPVMLDIVGLVLNEADLRRIRHPLTGGVILFSRNFASREQLIELTAAIHAARPGIPIAVDHEGGRVQRFRRDGFTHLPAMGRLGQIWDSGTDGPARASAAAVATGLVLAAELRACGVDISLTPVLDLDYGVSEVIGDRAFHRNADIVTQLARSLNHGLLLAGMANCGKHFPGHGYVAADSHLAIPVDERPLEAILAEDAAPFGDLGVALAAIMPGHVIYSAVDPAPAGFSSFWLKDILRTRLGFDGVIFSDDLSMEGASVAGDVVSGARAALDAGCDMVLVCNAPQRADELLAGLSQQNIGDFWPHRQESLRRINALMLASPFADWNALQADARYQRARATLRAASLAE